MNDLYVVLTAHNKRELKGFLSFKGLENRVSMIPLAYKDPVIALDVCRTLELTGFAAKVFKLSEISPDITAAQEG